MDPLSSTNFPRQRISLKEKDEAWQKACIDALIGDTSFNFDGYGDRDEKQKCYEYYNGTIDDKDYAHVLKPYGKARQDFPAKLQNYNMLKPTIDLLIGEYEKRPFNYMVTVSNPDVVSQKEKARNEALFSNLKQLFIQGLAEMGIIPDNPNEEPPPPPKEMMRQFEQDYRDSRANMGQEALNYLRFAANLDRRFSEGWFDFLVAGDVFTRKRVVNGEAVYDILNPVDVDYHKSPDTVFIEDGNWATIKQRLSPSDILDTMWKDLTKEEVGRIENPNRLKSDGFLYSDMSKSSDHMSDREVEVIYVTWKSMTRVGIVTYFNEDTGEEESYNVEDGFKKAEGEKVEWYWINEAWEGTRIDGDIYINVRPVQFQRRSKDNLAHCKLPINGRLYSDRNASNVSLLSLGIAYQLLYNIYNYRLENEIAKAKGMIARIDIDSIPNEEGWDIDKWLYYIDAIGISFENRAKDGAQTGNTYKDVLDLTAKTIQQFVGLLNYVLESWERLSGVSRQRAGMMSPYDGKGTTEQSIVQSSHITEDYFKKFEEFKEVELQGLLDLTKFAYVNGKKAMYMTHDYTQAILDLDGVEHMEAEYGVFVTGSARENRKVETMRALTQQMATQQNAPLSLIAEILDAENFSKLKQNIKEVEQAAQQAQQAQQQMEQQMQEQAQATQAQAMQVEAAENQKDRDTRIQVALIGASPEDNSMEMVKHGDNVAVKREELRQKAKADALKFSLDRTKLSADARFREEELDIKRKAVNKTPAS